MKRASEKPTGKIVFERNELDHYFQIEKLETPIRKGAGMRTHRLWCNGYPSSGGQWHYDLNSAIWRMEYILSGSYANKIALLENRNAYLEKLIRDSNEVLWIYPDV